ncbi:hypothetical protein FFI16_025140 [Pseudomonas sp. KBS0710]|nr:hypothetical protein FFI16_025140 [Pseudomonas sp. KBS0710]
MMNCGAICAAVQKSVGAGLLAKAECQSPNVLADPPHSRASPLPQLFCVSQLNWPETLNPVGAGLLAKAECQSPDVLADPPHSRASPLPHFVLYQS